MSEIYIKRPINSFMIYARKHRPLIAFKNKNLTNSRISELLGLSWNNLNDSEKKVYTGLAELEKQYHKNKYPNYIYKPRSKKNIKVTKKTKIDYKKDIEEEIDYYEYMQTLYETVPTNLCDFTEIESGEIDIELNEMSSYLKQDFF